MYKLKLFSVGKNKEEWLSLALAEYEKRLKSLVAIEYLYAKDDEQLLKMTAKEPLIICLDPAGQMLSSEQFATFIIDKFHIGGTKLAVVIGGPEGLPTQLRNHSLLISLSKMTLTHQCARLILIEQIYRALEIDKGSPYHK